MPAGPRGEIVAVLDACVLLPASLRDTLLRLAETPPLYIPKWSGQIWAEVTRNLGSRRKLSPGLNDLEPHPFLSPNILRPLTGVHRLRIGDWRVSFRWPHSRNILRLCRTCSRPQADNAFSFGREFGGTLLNLQPAFRVQ